MMSKIFPVLQYSEFYEKPIPDKLDSIYKYNPDLLIKELAHINAILYLDAKNDVLETQGLILANVFPLISEVKRNRIYQCFTNYKVNQASLILFCSPVIITIIGLVIKNCAHKKTDPPENSTFFQEDLLDIILFQNDIYFPNTTVMYPGNSYENIWYNFLNQQGYVRERTKTHEVYPLTAQFFKSFIENNVPDGKDLIEEFCSFFNINNFNGYIAPLLYLLLNALKAYKETKKVSYIVPLSDKEYKLLDKLSLNECDLLDPEFTVHMQLIPKPFWKNKIGEILILDFNLLGFINDSGLIFNFYSSTSISKKLLLTKWVDYKSFLGKNYYESYLVGQLIYSLFNLKGNKVFTDSKIYFSDFTIVQDGKDIFLIEVKSTSINAMSFESKNVSNFKEYLDSSFASRKLDADKKGKRNKGVFQLAKSIEKLTTSNMLDALVDENTSKKKLRIYPIIIYTDNSLDILGVNNYLNDYFIPAVEPYTKFVTEINPVIAINLGFFISHYSSIKTSRKYFRDSLRKYMQKIRVLKSKYRKDGKSKTFWDLNISFHQFISRNYKPPLDNYRVIEEDNLDKKW